MLAAHQITEIRYLQKFIHGVNTAAGWWSDLDTGASLVGKRNRGEMLMLIVTEIAEAMEGERKDCQDDKLPHRKMAEVELADAMLRLLDYAEAHGYDIGGAMAEKMDFNMTREDHRLENRKAANGKRF